MKFSGIDMDKSLKNDIFSLIEYNWSGLLGVESATAYWGLSTFPYDIPIFLINDDNEKSDEGLFVSGVLSMLFVRNVNTENVVQLSDNLYVTDIEQTVCDMVRYKRHEFHLYETLLSAYEGDVNIRRLEHMAEGYGVLNKMRRLYELALETEGEG